MSTAKGRLKEGHVPFFIALSGLVLSYFFSLSCSRKAGEPQEQTLLQKLQALPGFRVTHYPTLYGFSETFYIDFTQPIDHSDPSAGTFAQGFYLCYRSEGAPMVFYSSGYGIDQIWEPELSALLNANLILLVHRFFPGANPHDWRYLTIRQAADDQHRIREALRSLFTGKWISTGASKGGMAALFYRRFHPGDVDATVAYSAPVMTCPDDPRFGPFLFTVGSADCRQKIRDFQQLVFSRRASLLELFGKYNQSCNQEFSIIPEEAAFEYTVLEYPFSFWQFGEEDDCAGIPGEDADDQQALDHLVGVSSPYYYSDHGFRYYQPLFYQAFTEIGYYPFLYDHIKSFLQVVIQPDYRVFAPRGVELVFRPEVMQDVIPWLQNQGERIIYIYGGNDPWTAAAVQPAEWLDTIKIVQPGANHGVAISELDQKELVIQTLERWLNIAIDRSVLATWEGQFEKVRL